MSQFVDALFDPETDFFEYLRRSVVPYIGKYVSMFNEAFGTDLYVRSESTDSQFVGVVDVPESSFEMILDQMNFERNPLASLKSRSAETEEGSFRWLPPEDSDLDPAKQLHVIIYDGSVVPNANTGRTYIYAHWEYRWDWHPIKHYRGVDMDHRRGVEMMRAKLDEANVAYETELPTDE